MEVLESLIGAVRRCCAAFPDQRTGTNVRYAMPDIGMGAFSLFFVQSPSFLDFQRRLEAGHGRSNCQTLFGMSRIPTDNHIRAMLDPVAPDHLFPVFDEVVAALERSGGLAAFRRACGVPAAWLARADRARRHRVPSLHQDPLPELLEVHPRRPADRALPHDGVRHHRGPGPCPGRAARARVHPAAGRARKAGLREPRVRRWLARHGARYARLDPIYLGDDLLACQPVCEAVLAEGGHFLFTCKPSSHQTIQEYLTGIELDEHVERLRRGRTHATHTYRWLCDVPLRAGKDALTVNWLSIEIRDAKGKLTYRNSFITDLPVTRETVAELAACARARWKIENESFNVLKNGGYHLEHNFGHGQQHLASLLVCFNLLAFAIHTVADLAKGAWRHARETLGPRTRFFNNLQGLTTYLVFASWTELLETLACVRAPPRPP